MSSAAEDVLFVAASVGTDMYRSERVWGESLTTGLNVASNPNILPPASPHATRSGVASPWTASHIANPSERYLPTIAGHEIREEENRGD